MPRVYLTAEQREKAHLEDRKKALAMGLLAYRATKKITAGEQARVLGINPRSLTKVLAGEPCHLPIEVFWKMQDMAEEARKNVAGGTL